MFPGFGISLLIAGLVVVALAWLTLRMMPRMQATQQSSLLSQNFSESIQSKDAVLLLQPGGRVEYLSKPARDVFGLRENETYDLERLARYVRPSSDFLDVCSTPSSKLVSINGKLVELISYEVPGTYPAMLVALRSKENSGALEKHGANTNEILQIATQFSNSIASSLDLSTTVTSILSNIGKLVPSDVLELKIWDAERKALIPHRNRLTTTGSLISTTGSLTQSQFGNLTQHIVDKKTPLLVENVRASEFVNGELVSVQSYLGIPLTAGEDLIGTLEAGQLSTGAFGQYDLDLLVLISGQVAVALRNAKLYEDEQRRRAELTGLANLNQSLASVRDMQDIFTHLVESILPLFQVEIVGFLLYDEDKRILEGKNPFHGLPAQVVEIYRTNITADSPADKIIASQQPIITQNAMTDESWNALGLADVATAASLRDNALIPLLSSGHMLGYLQIGHHIRNSNAFNQEEIRLMNIVANQAAAVIENVLLVQQARGRALRADALRRISNLSASSATLNEILKYSIQELARLLQADSGAIFLVDEVRGVLSLSRESTYGVPTDISNDFSEMFIDDPNYRHSVSGSRKTFFSGRISADRRILPAYRQITNALKLESAIVVPLIVRDRSVGELMLGSNKVNHFNPFDLQIVTTAAGQIASVIETADLLNQTDVSLRKRVDQLSAITRVNKELGISLDMKHLLQVVHNEALQLSQADVASVLLFDAKNDLSSPHIQQVIGQEHQPNLNSAEQTAIKDNEPFIISDFIRDGIYPPYDGARSGIVLPIIYHSQALGLINVYANQANFFTTDTAELMQMLAGQVGVALSNAQRYQTEKRRSELVGRRSETLVRLTDVSYNLGNDQPLDQALQMIARALREVTAFRVVVISVLDEDKEHLRRVVTMGLSQETANELLARRQPVKALQQLMRPDFKISHSFLIPADQVPLVSPDLHTIVLDEYTTQSKEDTAWHPEDLFLIPLESTDGQLIGLISLDSPSNGLRPDIATIEAIEAFASQATLLLGNMLRQNDLRTRMESLSSALNRQQKLLDVAKNDLPILLRKDLEQTISLHNLDRRAQRVRAGLAITESVSRQLDAHSALLALGRETLTQLGMAVALIAENTPEGPRLIHILGSLPRSTNVEALFGQRNPLRAILQSPQMVLISNLDENDEWRDSSLLSSLRAKGVICLPILVENKPVAAILATSPEPLQTFTDEDRQVYAQISQQTSLILQNIKLLDQTRRRLDEVNLLLDFSHQLSGMETDAIIKSLLDSARRVIQTAHAGAVLVWNSKNETLTPRAVSGYADNESMMKIHYRLGEALPGNTFMNKRARRIDEINFVRDYNLTAENISHYRQATGGRLPVSSLMVPIVSNEQNLGLLILDNFNTTSAFRSEDEALLTSLAQQVALSMDNLRLVRDTQERAGQLQALNSASASLTSSLSSDQLVNTLLDQLLPILPYDTATLWLRERDRLTVVATRGFSDVEQRQGLSIAVADSALFKEMGQTGQPILVKDVREDPRFPPVESPRLSWLGIPLISKGEMVGVLAVEKWQANYFTREQVQVGLTFASQSAVSLDNARLYEDSVKRATELDQRSERLTTLNRFTSALTRSLDTEQILNLTAEELLKGLNASRVSVVTFERGQALWKIATPRIRAKLPRILPDAPIFSRLRESLGIFNTDNIRNEPDLHSIADMFSESTTALLVLPLAPSHQLLALLFVQMEGEARFNVNELEIARTITNQGTIALENAQLYQSSVRTARRFSVLNETSSLISSSFESEQIYASVHHAAERLMPLDTFVITLLDVDKNEIDPVYLVERGKRYYGERVPFGKGMSSEVISSGKPLLISSTTSISDIEATTFGDTEENEVQSIVAVPMIVGGKALGMLSAQSYLVDIYTDEDMQILGTLANQAIVAIQNGRLFAQTQKLVNEQEANVAERTAQLNQEKQNTDTLLRILTEVSSSLDLDRTLNRTLSLLNDTLGAEQGTILLVNPEDNLLHYRAGYGYMSDRVNPSARSFTLKIGEGLAGWVVKHREAVLVGDLHQDARWVQSDASGQDHRSAIVTPMMVSEDAIGVLMVFHRKPNFFNTEMLNLVKAIAAQVSVAINNANLYELIRDQAERLGTMLRKEQVEASRSQAILEAVADGVLVTGADNHITFVNSSTVRILEVDEARLLGSPLDMFAGLAGKWIETIARWSADPSSYQQNEMYAEQLTLENGRIVLVHLAPVILQNDFLGTVSIFRDITREVEVDRLKSEFVATVSHELRTPMTAIKGYVDILTMGAAGALNENQMHFLDVVRNNIVRLNILVNDLLDISRIESGKVTLNNRSVNLYEIAEEVITETLRRSQAENKPMALSVDAPKNLPHVIGDTDRVRQILNNLVNNAYNYTPANGTIHVNIHQENGNLQVDVQDNGIGIKPTDQERLFERFYRGEDPLVLATPGTGLGLPIVRQLVEMHNGKLWMTSTGIPGEGSVFSFTLPIEKIGE